MLDDKLSLDELEDHRRFLVESALRLEDALRLVERVIAAKRRDVAPAA